MRSTACRFAGNLISKAMESVGAAHAQQQAIKLAAGVFGRDLVPTVLSDGAKAYSVLGFASESTPKPASQACLPAGSAFLPASAAFLLAQPRMFSASAPDQGASNAKASDDKSAGSAEGADAASKAEESSSSSGAEGEGGEQSREELLAALKAKEEGMGKLTAQVEKLTDALKRSLADMENLRVRTAKEVDNAKKFALQKFIKDLLDVVDNLERATGAVPKDVVAGEADVDKVRHSLKGLLEGVQAVESIMLKVLKQHGVARYDPINEKFDPNLHSALFEMPDPTKEPGTIANVTKRGYMLNERVIRPAEVGVVRQA